jgi:hypothetical protein
MNVKFVYLILRDVPRLRVLYNKVLNGIFGTKRADVGEKWDNKELHNLYSSPNIKVIKSRNMTGM